MKTSQLIIASVSLALLVCFFGCGTDSQTAGRDDSSTHAHDDGTHTHADGSVHKDHSEEGHSHAPGPHGGAFVDWGGGKFHVEFLVDHENQEAATYVYGSDEKTPSPINATEISLTIKEPSLTIALKPVPQNGDPDGSASCFVGKHEILAKAQEYEGSLSGVVDGTPFSGKFKEDSHDH